MDERDRRNAQSGWDDRDERNQRQGNERQPQQWRDENYRGAGQTPSSGNPNDDDDARERGQGRQMGGSQGSYSGDRSRTDTSDEDRARNEGTGEYRSDRVSPNSGEQRRSYGHYSADRYSGGGDRYTRGRYTQSRGGGFGSFTSEDQGGRDFELGGRYYGSGSASDYGSAAGGEGYRRRGSRRGDETSRDTGDYGSWREYGEKRGFFEKAGDEIASWFGNEDAARRREQDHRGRGPAGYTRSDERIREDANDHLTHDPSVDATNITVKVENGEVTLDGSVDSRQAKRRAEDVVDGISGVRHVQNNLRVNENRGYAASGSSGLASATGTGVSTSTGAPTSGGANATGPSGTGASSSGSTSGSTGKTG